MGKKSLLKSTAKKGTPDKSKAEVAAEDLAAVCEAATKKSIEKVKAGKQACFGTAMLNPDHDSCKKCKDIEGCKEAQPVKPKSASKPKPVDPAELAAMCEDEGKTKKGGKAKKGKVSATALAASIEAESKGSEDSKTKGKVSDDARAPDGGEKATGEAEAEPKEAKSALPEPDIDTKKITKTKSKRKSAKDGKAPKSKPNPKVKPIEGPATAEHILPYVKLQKHPDVDLGKVIQAVLDAKPETTGEMAQLVVQNLAAQSPQAARNSAYGKTRNIRETLIGYGDIAIEGKQITWLKK